MPDQLIIGDLIALFQRDLSRLSSEIESFNDDSNLWKVDKGVTNSAGNLALHICGNLNHFIGSIIGSTGYVRDRDGEFNDSNYTKAELIDLIRGTAEMIDAVMSAKAEEELQALYPIEVLKSPMSLRYFFLHLYGHLNYHLGQVNYLRRILES